MSYVDEVIEQVVAQNPAEPEFHQVYRFKGKKWVRVTTTKKTSYKYKKAPKNGSYKVRAVKTSGKKKIYGAFSKVKKIK